MTPAIALNLALSGLGVLNILCALWNLRERWRYHTLVDARPAVPPPLATDDDAERQLRDWEARFDARFPPEPSLSDLPERRTWAWSNPGGDWVDIRGQRHAPNDPPTFSCRADYEEWRAYLRDHAAPGPVYVPPPSPEGLARRYQG